MKKTHPTWVIAAFHMFLGGILMPALLAGAAGLILTFFLLGSGTSESDMLTMDSAIDIPLWLITTLVGPWFSARFLNVSYFLIDTEQIAWLSTVYLVLVNIVFLAAFWSYIGEAFTIVMYVITTLIFYFASRWSLKQYEA